MRLPIIVYKFTIQILLTNANSCISILVACRWTGRFTFTLSLVDFGTLTLLLTPIGMYLILPTLTSFSSDFTWSPSYLSPVLSSSLNEFLSTFWPPIFCLLHLGQLPLNLDKPDLSWSISSYCLSR